ncbi:MAG: DUF3040 domain-containing protein, partial [Nocardioidaceae bacterium]
MRHQTTTPRRLEDKVPLSEEEQRLLEQMEQALAAEDPKFVSTIRGAASRAHHKRIVVLGCLGFVLGVAALMTGAVMMNTWIAVAGFLVMLGSAYAALVNFRRLGDPDLPSNVTDIREARGGSERQAGGFMHRMED